MMGDEPHLSFNFERGPIGMVGLMLIGDILALLGNLCCYFFCVGLP